MARHRCLFSLPTLVSLALLSVPRAGFAAPDAALQPPTLDETPVVFEGVAVVQQKAVTKGGKFIFSPSFSFDLSDGPKTMYSTNLSLGYAISDFWEIYLTGSPFYISQERSIVERIRSVELADPDSALAIEMASPKYHVGAQIHWAFGYGKDSLGLNTLVRSDTFLRLGGAQIYYDGGDTGLRFHGGVGKTYFFNKWAGVRPEFGVNYLQTIVGSVKRFTTVFAVEIGLVGYL